MSTGKTARKRKRRRYIAGVPPGALIADPDAAKSVVHVLAFGPENFTEAEVHDLQSLPQYLEQWPVTWINVNGLGNLEIIRGLGELFGLHRLALEDVLNVHHHPKVEEYEGYVFVVLRMLEPGTAVHTEQLSMFIGKRLVVTFQERPGDCLDSIRKRIREGRGRVRNMGADYLGYYLIDAVIDAYYPCLDEFSERMEALEEHVLARPDPQAASEIHVLKRNLLALRRALAPLREALNSLIRDESELLSETTRIHLRDCYDHLIQLLDIIELHREIVGGLLEVYLTAVSNRTNDIMKVLTIIATVFIPLGFLAGVYGMNFENMPELKWYWGYPAVLFLALGVAVGELLLFWKKGWLGSADKLMQEKPQADAGEPVNQLHPDPSPGDPPERKQVG